MRTLHLTGLVCLLIMSACTSFGGVPHPQPTLMVTPSLNTLFEQFSSPDPIERANAANSAGYYSDHSDKALLVPYLVTALSDSDERVRTFAASSIGDIAIYDEQAVRTMIRWLDEKGHSTDELTQAMRAIETFAGYIMDTPPGLIEIMLEEQSSTTLRIDAMCALSALGDPVAIPYLLEVFSHEDEEAWIRARAGFSLTNYETTAACTVPSLVPLLYSSESEISIIAAIVINQATDNNFPDAGEESWSIGPGGELFLSAGKGDDGEYFVVTAAKKWWQEVGQYESWSACN